MSNYRTNEEKRGTLTTADLAAANEAQSQSKPDPMREYDGSTAARDRSMAAPDRTMAAPDRTTDTQTKSAGVSEPNAAKEPLISDDGSRKGRWEEIQARFVD